MKRCKASGFTLIEVVIAVAIFGILSATAYSILFGLMKQQGQMTEHADQMRDLQLAVKYLERDIFQMSDRDVRDRFGDRQLAVSYDDDHYLTMTYSGWRNPAGMTRSSFRRIRYQFEEDQLIRVSWNELDGYFDETMLQRRLLDNLNEFSVEFLDESNEWRTQWPPANRLSNSAAMPRAIAVTLNVDPWGEIRRVFPTPR